jgi:hypothetical protein
MLQLLFCKECRPVMFNVIPGEVLARVAMSLVLSASVAGVAHAQRTPSETVPGGVEAKPSDGAPGAPKTMQAPAAPLVSSPSRSPALETVPRASPAKPAIPPPKDPKDDKGKKSGKAAQPIPLTQSLAPGKAAPAAGAPAAPVIGGNESKPGAVERAPAMPKQLQ